MDLRSLTAILGGALGLSTFVVGSAPAASPTPSDRPYKTLLRTPIVKTPLDLSTGRPLLGIKVNKHTDLTLPLDTGTFETRLDANLVRRAGLGPVESGRVRIDSLEIGDALFWGVTARVVPPGSLDDEISAYGGVLGLSLFSDCVFTLDYDANRLVLRQGELGPVDGVSVLGLKADGGGLRLPLSFDGVSADVIVSTVSNGAFTLAQSLRHRVTVRPRMTLGTTKTHYLSDIDLAEPTLPGPISIGRYRLIQSPVRFHDGASTLGNQVLKHFLVIVDQKNHRILFAHNGNDSITVAKPSRFGLVFRREPTMLVVEHVFHGSPADKWGIKQGESIIEIAHRRISDLTDDAILGFLREAESFTLKINHSGVHLLVVLHAVK